MKNILVTGGAGFIGSNLVKRLVKDGYQVSVLDNLLQGNKIDPEVLSRINFVEGDVLNIDDVRRAAAGTDLVIHLAAVLGVDVVADEPMKTMEVEVHGFKNVFDVIQELGHKKIMYASTSGVYGHGKIEDGITEDVAVAPDTSYAVAKRYNEVYLQSALQNTGIESVCMRFFNIYGATQDNRMVIPRFFEMAMNGTPITVYGDGRQTRDFTYIDDAVESVVQLMHHIKGWEIFNIAKEDEIYIKDLAEMILKVTEGKAGVKYMPAPQARIDYEVTRRYGSSEKLKRVTGYQPDTSLEQGLRQIYAQIVERV